MSFDSVVDLSAFTIRISQADVEKLPHPAGGVGGAAGGDAAQHGAGVAEVCVHACMHAGRRRRPDRRVRDVGALPGHRGDSAATLDAPFLAGLHILATAPMPSASGSCSNGMRQRAGRLPIAASRSRCRCLPRCQTWTLRRMMHLGPSWAGRTTASMPPGSLWSCNELSCLVTRRAMQSSVAGPATQCAAAIYCVPMLASWCRGPAAPVGCASVAAPPPAGRQGGGKGSGRRGSGGTCT